MGGSEEKLVFGSGSGSRKNCAVELETSSCAHAESTGGIRSGAARNRRSRRRRLSIMNGEAQRIPAVKDKPGELTIIYVSQSHGSTSTKILRLPLKLNIFVLQDAQSTRRQVLPLGHYGSDSRRQLQNKSATNSRSLSARDLFDNCFHPTRLRHLRYSE